MTGYRWGFLGGFLTAVGLALAVGYLFSFERSTRLIVAAMDIDEGTPITVTMLEDRSIPTRYLSKRKLGATSVAGIMGQLAPQSMRRGDFVDPTHFGPRIDACVSDAKASAARSGLTGPELDAFLARLEQAGR